MKLLFDQNLSPRLVQALANIYPESVHVREIGLRGAEDSVIWSHAEQHDFTIVSKDSDFHQRSFVLGAPPKFVFLRVGNCPTSGITGLLRSEGVLISAFINDPSTSILVLT